jgi:endonuclease-3
VVAVSRKRKRNPSQLKAENVAIANRTRVKTELKEESVVLSITPTKDRKVRRPAREVKNEATGEVEIHAPSDWETMYNLVKEMRLNGTASNAAVDTMGCDSLAEEQVNPRDKRYQTLTALMLSSQTKDTVTSAAIKRLQTELPPYEPGAPIGLNLENILAIEPAKLNELIRAVGFHNNKTKFIKATALILRDQFDGEIPSTIEGLVSLPGVGPKMAYLCMSSAWGRDEGIGVDVHVHRITNLWGWNGTSATRTPEETRIALQRWLPSEKWHEINWLLVGLGQTVCLPVGRKCGECELGLRGLCKSAERAKVTLGRRVREQRVKSEGDGEAAKKEEEVVIKEEIKEEEIPVNATNDAEVIVKEMAESDEEDFMYEDNVKTEDPEALEDTKDEFEEYMKDEYDDDERDIKMEGVDEEEESEDISDDYDEHYQPDVKMESIEETPRLESEDIKREIEATRRLSIADDDIIKEEREIKVEGQNIKREPQRLTEDDVIKEEREIKVEERNTTREQSAEEGHNLKHERVIKTETRVKVETRPRELPVEAGQTMKQEPVVKIEARVKVETRLKEEHVAGTAGEGASLVKMEHIKRETIKHEHEDKKQVFKTER